MDTARLRDLELDRPSPSTASQPEVPEAAREQCFEDFLTEMLDGRDGAREVVIEDFAWSGISVDEEAADVVLDLWRRYGLDKEGVGHFLDRLCKALAPIHANDAKFSVGGH